MPTAAPIGVVVINLHRFRRINEHWDIRW